MTSSQKKISDQINAMIASGQGMSLLQKLEFDILVNDINELGNYIIILLILVETPAYRAEASDLLIKKVLLTEDFKFLKNRFEQTYSELFRNRIWPFVGLSEVIRRLIATIIYNEEKDSEIIPKIPRKEFLIDFNIRLIKEFFEIEPDNIEIGTNLLYNCWFDVELPDRKVKLSRVAIDIYKNALELTTFAFDNYLHLFLRFYWYGGSRQWDEGKLIVLEPFYLQIFDSLEGFLAFLDKIQGDQRRPLTNDLTRLYEDIKRFMYYFKKDGHVAYDDPNVGLELELHYHLIRELSRK
jgi:hypothetical protein